jgi:uncharacterized protein with HEPN domain
VDYARTAQSLADGRSRADLDTDLMFRLALTRAVEVVGEAANRLSDQVRFANPEVPWAEIRATRNRLVHGYDIVDLDVLWKIVNHHLPPLIGQLEAILAKHQD